VGGTDCFLRAHHVPVRKPGEHRLLQQVRPQPVQLVPERRRAGGGHRPDAYLIYKSFFQALWSAGFETGQSIILVSMILVVLGIGYVAYLKVSAAQRLAQPVAAFDDEA
jgi:hypothetical protein